MQSLHAFFGNMRDKATTAAAAAAAAVAAARLAALGLFSVGSGIISRSISSLV